MKRLAAVVVLLLMAGAWVEARPLPKPASLNAGEKTAGLTHGVRGDERRLPVPPRLGTGGPGRPANLTHAIRGK